MELFAFKLSLSHLERRSVNETIPFVKYTSRQRLSRARKSRLLPKNAGVTIMTSFNIGV